MRINSDKWNSHCDWSLHQYTKNRHLLYIYAAYLTVHPLTFLVYIVEFRRNSKNWSNEWGWCLNDGMDERLLRNILRKNADNNQILWSTISFL